MNSCILHRPTSNRFYDLPDELQFLIFSFDPTFITKFKASLAKVNSQFLKGGFNVKSYNIKKFMNGQKERAKHRASFRVTAYYKVSIWLRNIEKFENTYPASYLRKINNPNNVKKKQSG